MWYVIVWALCFIGLMAVSGKDYVRVIKDKQHRWIGVLLLVVSLMFAPYFLLNDLFRKVLDRAMRV